MSWLPLGSDRAHGLQAERRAEGGLERDAPGRALAAVDQLATPMTFRVAFSSVPPPPLPAPGALQRTDTS